jgi:hypothetical protein
LAIQRQPAPAPATPAARGAAIKAIGDRAASRQQIVGSFATKTLQTLTDLDGYYAGLNSSYQRCWDHVNVVLAQAAQQAANQAQVAQFITAVGLGVVSGLTFELAGAVLGSTGMLAEMFEIVKPFMDESISNAAQTTLPGPPPAGSPAAAAPSPLLIQAKTFEKQRTLYRNALDLSAKALQTFGPIIDTARKAERDDNPDTAKIGALQQADGKGAEIEKKITEQTALLEQLVQRRNTAGPNDRTIEQTIWVAYLASRGSVALTHITGKSWGGEPNALANHLRDLGMIGINPRWRPEPTEKWVPHEEPTPLPGGGGTFQSGHTERVEAPGEGLLQFTLYSPEGQNDGKRLSQAAAGLQGWAQSATSSFLLETDTNFVEAR